MCARKRYGSLRQGLKTQPRRPGWWRPTTVCQNLLFRFLEEKTPKKYSQFWNLHSWHLFFIAVRTWMRIMKLEEHFYFSSGFKKLCLVLKDYIQCGSGPTVFARAQLLNTPSAGRNNSSEQSGRWAGRRPPFHWSPSRKPCPQLCLPPPPFWSAARLMLAGGTPNPDTPPLLLGSQRYLEGMGGKRREDNQITAT